MENDKIITDQGRNELGYEERVADPCVMVIFGASGDLTRRKLVPSLYNLAQNNLLNSDFAVVGFARQEMSHDEFRRQMREAIQEFGTDEFDPALWEKLEKRLYYLSGELDDPTAYSPLVELLEQVDNECGTQGNYLYYLATPPDFFSVIAGQLGQVGLAQDNRQASWRRIIVEKPFGRDLDSARALNKQLLDVFDEAQIYRIDHYLGKETVQNILVFRFANGIFEPIWDRRYIDHVQIMVAESIGVEQRGGY